MAVRVGVGLGRFNFAEMDGFRAWLDLCEGSQIDSIWHSDQVISRETFHEPLSLLAVVAGATRRLKIGTNAVVIGFRDPVTFARQCASIDHLSEGRFLPVIGVGGEASEAWKATGRTPKRRGARANEALEVMTRLWSEENVSFEGEFIRVNEATISPRPVQQPLPLWIGGSSPAAIRRTVRYGTGWLAGLQDVDGAVETAKAIREENRAQNGSVASDHYGATVLYRIQKDAPNPKTESEAGSALKGAAKLMVKGPADALIDRLRAYVNGGISKFVAIPFARDEADLMEQTRLLDQEVIPEVSGLKMPVF